MTVVQDYEFLYPSDAETAGLVFVALFFAVAAIWAAAQLAVYVHQEPKPLFSGPKAFHVVVILACLARFGVYVSQLVAGWNSPVGFVMHRLSVAGFFTVFAMIVWNWALLLQTTSPSSTLPNIVKPVLVLVTVVLYIYQLVVIALNAQQQLPTPVYNSDVLLVAALTLAASLLSAVLAAVLLRRLSETMQAVTHQPAGRRRMLKLALMAGSMTLAFAIRFGMYLVRPVSGTILPLFVFQFFAYVLPDLVPSCLQLILFRPRGPSILDVHHLRGAAGSVHSAADPGAMYRVLEQRPPSGKFDPDHPAPLVVIKVRT